MNLYIHTISSRPNINAISPPVLVPQIKSKHSQGLGGVEFWVSAPPCLLTWFISSCKMYNEEIPRTPPPSRQSTRSGGSMGFQAGSDAALWVRKALAAIVNNIPAATGCTYVLHKFYLWWRERPLNFGTIAHLGKRL